MRGDLSWPLQRAARLHGSKPAITASGRTIDYATLARRVGGLGAALAELGISPGGCVGYLGVNSLAHLEAWLGVPAFGRVLVDLNTRLAEAELAFMARDAGIECLIAGTEHVELAHALGIPRVIADSDEYEQLVDRPPATPPGVDADALATISYTGGTTGVPKGVMLSHANLLANARHNLVATGHRAEHRFLHVCPMFHVAGTANVFACTWVGADQVVLPRFDPAAVLATIPAARITHTLLVPTMIAMLLDADDGADLSVLRSLQYAASPITPDVQQRILERLPDCDIAQFYGMTEAAPTVTRLSGADHRAGGERLRSIGLPVAGVEVEVRGDPGELWVRGPNVMLGYWNRPDATADALVDGWYRSGDAARVDDDGYLYIVDRLKDMIISGGENVYSIEVEAVLSSHPAVTEAAVFGVPHPQWGEAVHAVVVSDRAVTADQLITHCRAAIAGYKVPRSIDVRAEPLPKSGAGKVLKHQLREP